MDSEKAWDAMPAAALGDEIVLNFRNCASRQAPTNDEYRCRLPSFFIVGPPRTGTTWLSEVLGRHATLPAPSKETRFFDVHFHRGFDWYLDHFPCSPRTRMVGEAAPTYFASPHARERIARALPDAKVVIVFRHPVERLVSLYRLKRAYGRLECDLETALRGDPELLGSSRYATHLAAWQSFFPAHQLSIHQYKNLSADPQAFVDGLCDFLEMPRFPVRESALDDGRVFSTARMTEPKHFLITRAATAMADWCKARKLDNVVAGVRNSRLVQLFLGGGPPFPEIPQRTLDEISALLLPEIEALEANLGCDLSHWKRLPEPQR
ncbi:MAG: sulfotransferase family protein [Acidobacteriaceae bacterium]